MNLLVTGGAGFIGSAFVRLAAESGLRPPVVDKLTYAGDLQRLLEVSQGMRIFQTDIADEEALEEVFTKVRPSAVVHFAAETHVDRSILSPREFVVSNVVGTTNLLSLSLKHGIERFVHISTDEVYGELPADKAVTFKETDPLLPNSPYSASKAAADMFARAYSKTFGLPCVTVRPSNNFGPYQYPEKLIPLTIARILNGEKIPVYGKGENIRTWLFVEDCVAGILRVLQDGRPGEIYNIGSREERQNIEIVKSLLDLLGGGEDLIEFVPDRPGHDYRYAVDTSKIERELGWSPAHSLKDGLSKTVQWYCDNRDWLFGKKAETEIFVKALRESYRELQR
jgi:dTDP-glucose 4,6-dehydratase